jgi:hypothetical protein
MRMDPRRGARHEDRNVPAIAVRRSQEGHGWFVISMKDDWTRIFAFEWANGSHPPLRTFKVTDDGMISERRVQTLRATRNQLGSKATLDRTELRTLLRLPISHRNGHRRRCDQAGSSALRRRHCASEHPE